MSEVSEHGCCFGPDCPQCNPGAATLDEHPEDREAEEQLHALMVETSTPDELFRDLVNRTGIYRDA